VRILRVFDFFGVVEATNEIIEMLDQDVRLSKPSPRSARKIARRRLGIVPDSEDEEDMELSEDEAVEDSILPPSSIGFVIIDNLTTVMNPLLKTNHVNGRWAYFFLLLSR
jgi:hypothetical protein